MYLATPFLGLSQLYLAHKDGKMGYVDSSGVMIIPPSFTSAEEFVKGKAAVAVGSEWGLIDTLGDFIIEPKYSKLTILGDSIIGIKKKGKYGVNNIFTNQELGATFDKVDRFLDNYFVGYIGNKAGLFNIQGDTLINPSYYKIYCQGNKSYITAETYFEKVIFNREMDSLMAFPVRSNLKYFPKFVVNKLADRYRQVYDKNGVFVDSIPRAVAYSISENIVGFEHYEDSQTVVVYYDDSAKVFPMNRYDFLSKDYLTITNGKGKKALFRTSGEQLTEFNYKAIGFNPRTKVFVYQGNKGAQIGADGKLFNNEESYDYINFLSSKLLVVRRNYKWGLIKVSGEKILNCVYESYSGDSLNLKAYSSKGLQLIAFNNQGDIVERRTFKNFGRIQLRMTDFGLPNTGFLGVRAAEVPYCLKFSDFGWFNVMIGGKYYFGMLDTLTGDTLVKPKYHSVCVCDSSGLTKVGFRKKKKNGIKFLNEKKNKYSVFGLVDRRGKRLTALRYQSIDEQSLRDSSIEYLRTVSEKLPSSVTLIRVGDKSYRKTYRFVDRSYQGLARASKKGSFRILQENKNIFGWDDYFLRTFWSKSDNSFRSKDGVKGVSIEDAKWGFINTQGVEIIPFEYDYVTNFKNGVSFVRKEGSWGAIDTAGIIIIPIKYSYIDYSTWNRDVIKVFNDSENWGILSEKGELLTKPQYQIIKGSYHGQYLVGNSKRKLKYINKEGGVSFPSIKSASYGVFKDGVAKVGVRRKWGVIDSTGEILIEPIYRTIGDYNAICFSAKLKSSWQIYNYKSEELLSFNPRRLSYLGEDFFIGSKKYKIGVFTLEGQRIISPRFSHIRFQDGGFLVYKNGKCGWYNKEGGKVIPAKFNKLYVSNENRIVGVKNRKVYGFTMKGEKVFKTDTLFDCKEFNNGLVPVKSKKGWGAVDSMGNTVAKGEYYRFESFHDSTSTVFKQGRAALMFNDGKILHNKWHRWIGAYSEGSYLVWLPGGGNNFLTTKGAFVNGIHYSHCRSFQDGYAVVFNDKAGVINRDGVTVIPHRYQDLRVIPGNGFMYKAKETYGFYKLDGTPINKKPISEIVFRDNLIQCLQGVEIGYLDRQGNVVRNIQ